jgi:hypothetical protein
MCGVITFHEAVTRKQTYSVISRLIEQLSCFYDMSIVTVQFVLSVDPTGFCFGQRCVLLQDVATFCNADTCKYSFIVGGLNAFYTDPLNEMQLYDCMCLVVHKSYLPYTQCYEPCSLGSIRTDSMEQSPS